MLIWQAKSGSRIEHRFSRQQARSGRSGTCCANTGKEKECPKSGLRLPRGWTGRSSSLVERGIQSPNIVILLKIAEVLNVPAAEMIAKTETAIRNPSVRPSPR